MDMNADNMYRLFLIKHNEFISAMSEEKVTIDQAYKNKWLSYRRQMVLTYLDAFELVDFGFSPQQQRVIDTLAQNYKDMEKYDK